MHVCVCVSTVTQLGPDGVISLLIHLFPQLKHFNDSPVRVFNAVYTAH